jgi:hypothetical protein
VCLGVERRAVESIFAKVAKRDLVSDRLADQSGASIQQTLNGPCVLVGHWTPTRPVMIATSGRLAPDIEKAEAAAGTVRLAD